jgi:hypothetical protein
MICSLTIENKPDSYGKWSLESEMKMKNPFGPEQDSLYSYVNLKKRMLQRVQAARVNDQIFQVVQKAYEDAIKQENIVLSRPERQRMFAQILKQVLDGMIKKLDKGTAE